MKISLKTKITKSACLVGAGILMVVTSSLSIAKPAYVVNGKEVKEEDVYRENQGRFYELEKQKYELIQSIAREAYLDSYFEEMASKQKVDVEKARKEYLEAFARVSESEIKETLDRFKDNPQLQAMSDDEKRQRVTEYLKSGKSRSAVERIVTKAIATKSLVVKYPKPEEPIFDISITDSDHVKYGPKAQDTKAVGCKGDDCAITVVEYSEFQCPFCVKVLPATSQLLEEYKGKVRWIVRDFPLSFHDRARPAAIAAQCAGEQGRYWDMYQKLFDNQRKLGDEDLNKYGKEIGLDMKQYDQCIKEPDKWVALINKNIESGERVGVTGTPAFFINGRRMSGALPYEQFKEVFEEELAKIGKKKS